MEITGGCLCRSVRYRITAAPIVTRVCWCRLCQYLGAGAGTVNVCFPSNAITIEGEMKEFRSVADSGNVTHRRFCPNCGTPLFSEAEPRPHLIFVRAGTLDDPEGREARDDDLDVAGSFVGLHPCRPAEGRSAAAAGGLKTSVTQR
jgi:hypothetical protein